MLDDVITHIVADTIDIQSAQRSSRCHPVRGYLAGVLGQRPTAGVRAVDGGAFLRAFTHVHTQQLASVARQLLINLAERTPMLDGANQ